jgi:hypothetical protein
MPTFATRTGVLAVLCASALGLDLRAAPAPQQKNTVTNTNSNNPVFRGPTQLIRRTDFNTALVGPTSPFASPFGAYPIYAGGVAPAYPAPYAIPPSYPGVGPFTATLTSQPGGAYPAPYSQDPGAGYGPTYPDYYGGYLNGQADIINATGRYYINVERSRLARQQVRQAKIDTRRRAFDEYLYERKNAPTWEDDRERLLGLSLRRSLNDPPITEIWSGKALNDLLAEVQKHRVRSTPGLAFPLDEELLRRINVTAGKSPGNVGLLKNDGKLNWPVAIRSLKPRDKIDDLRRQISSLLPETINQAVNGKVDPMSLKELIRATDEMQDLLTQNVTNLPPGQYMDAKRFLSGLDDGVKLLQQPDAGLYFTQKYTARGKTVPELVQNMTKTGLLFAPAVAGDEAAYVALHRALVAYAMALRGGPPESESR